MISTARSAFPALFVIAIFCTIVFFFWACGKSDSPSDGSATEDDHAASYENGADDDDSDEDTFIVNGDRPACPCTPVIHDTQGYRENIEFQRYRFVGGSLDGQRIAVLFSHFGPSSHAPFVNLIGYESGSRIALFHRGLFSFAGGEEELQLMENQVIAEGAQDMEDAEIVSGENLPTPVAWCMEGDNVFACTPDVAQNFAWETFEETCPEKDSILQWRLCTGSFGEKPRCLIGTIDPDWDCLFPYEYTLQLTVRDIFVANDNIWVVADRKIEAMVGLYFHAMTLGGRSLPF